MDCTCLQKRCYQVFERPMLPALQPADSERVCRSQRAASIAHLESRPVAAARPIAMMLESQLIALLRCAALHVHPGRSYHYRCCRPCSTGCEYRVLGNSHGATFVVLFRRWECTKHQMLPERTCLQVPSEDVDCSKHSRDPHRLVLTSHTGAA
jgi:hypothetical protein